MGVHWSDVSQYQGIPVDDTYPHRVFAFRTNSGSSSDTLAVENAQRAKSMLERGRLDAVIAYWFFRPGQANCDLHRDLLQRAGLWGNPRLVSMIDVEDAGGAIRGNQSVEVNDEVQRVRGWYGNPARVIGYWNPNANPDLWPARPAGLRLIIPQYNGRPGDLSGVKNTQAQGEAFAHQYTDSGSCAPWPNGVDLNYTPLELPDLLAMFGIQGGTMTDVVAEGAAQLHPFDGKLRQIQNPDHVNESTREPKEPWPYDIWSDLWNETVWDGFTLPDALLGDDAATSLVGWTLDTAKRVRDLDAKLDRILAAVAKGDDA